jgi:hypothetical protein
MAKGKELNNTEEKQVKKITLGLVLGWLFGGFFLLSGFLFVLTFTSLATGILCILIGVLTFPPANNFLVRKTNISLSKGLRIIIVFVLLVLVGILGEGQIEDELDASKETDESIVIDTEESSEEETQEAEEEQAPNQEVVEETDQTTMGERNALRSALDYLDYSAFSYSGLVEQLEYEGYSNEEAVYAVDNCGADWNEQAALSAQSYIDYSAFSRTGLIEQLEYEGFTREQAEYGVAAVGY